MQHDATRRDATDATRQDTTDATTGVVVNVATAADLLGISAGAVRKRLERGQLAGHKEAGQWRVVLAGIDATDTTRRDATDATRRDGQDRTGHDATEATPTAVSPAARSQLEAIRDEWLAPLVARIEELAGENGALRERAALLEAERDRLAAAVDRDRGLADQLVDLLQEERDALRWERDRLAAQAKAAPDDWRALAEAAAERDALRAEAERLRGALDAPLDGPEATGAAAEPDPAFHPSVAAWRERTTRAVDLDAPAAAPPWWRRFRGRRR